MKNESGRSQHTCTKNNNKEKFEGSEHKITQLSTIKNKLLVSSYHSLNIAVNIISLSISLINLRKAFIFCSFFVKEISLCPFDKDLSHSKTFRLFHSLKFLAIPRPLYALVRHAPISDPTDSERSRMVFHDDSCPLSIPGESSLIYYPAPIPTKVWTFMWEQKNSSIIPRSLSITGDVSVPALSELRRNFFHGSQIPVWFLSVLQRFKKFLPPFERGLTISSGVIMKKGLYRNNV